jgi:glycerol-3-phosphate dehydrogenase subunit C
MLEAVDHYEGDVSQIKTAEYRKIVDLCWQCKLCFNHCPYTPPHRFGIDFPRLILRAKAARAAAEGVSRRDRWLGNVDVVGAFGSATAPLSNWANGFKPHRVLLEAAVGVHRDRNLPRFHHKTFARWFRETRGTAEEPSDPATGQARTGDTLGGEMSRSLITKIAAVRKPSGTRKVALFYSCSVNYNEPQVGRDTVSILEKNGCRVACPPQVCCGMPYLDGGDMASAAANARKNIAALAPLVDEGAPVLVPQPTCSYVLKKEYPMLAPGADADKVARATRDLFEYLVGRHREGTLSTDFPGRGPGRVAYQIPCHLRAQNIGSKTSVVLQLIPGTKVRVVERCTAMDGTWAMKKENYELSLAFARRAAAEMEADRPDTFTTDCSLSALQIEAVRGVKPPHPTRLLREAYGLPEEH